MNELVFDFETTIHNMQELINYFEKRVIRHSGYYDTDCWQFKTKGDRDGYPQVNIYNHPKIRRAHRLSYIIHKGEIPHGMLVCHTCDNPWCVNPEHLFLGTPQDNMDDKYRKNRNINVQGEKVGGAKLNALEVTLIRNSPLDNRNLAAKYGVTHSLISAIRLRKCWKHV